MSIGILCIFQDTKAGNSEDDGLDATYLPTRNPFWVETSRGCTGQRNRPIENLNLKDLQGELSNRTQYNSRSTDQRPNQKSDQKDPKSDQSDSEPEQSDSESHKKPGMARSRSPNKRGDPPKCSHCTRLGHIESKCWFKHPNLAPLESPKISKHYR
jgi:hypothetical protein